jgi:hypothetical protein
VELEATPPLAPAVAKALASLLDEIDPWRPRHDRNGSAWRRAGLAEAVGEAEDAFDYALSPRSTRGATRA